MENVIALVALTVMEIVLGIDNIVFISVVTGKLPAEQRRLARAIGLGLAMGARVVLLLGISWIMKLTHPIATLSELHPTLGFMHGYGEANELTWKDLILLIGGLFLIRSSVTEIHHKMEGDDHSAHSSATTTFNSAIGQIIILDVVFSLDSVITAVGMAKDVRIMITSIVIAVLIMMMFAGYVSRFVENHPTVKMLALAFLLLIGVMLTAEAIGTHIDKGYIYFAMAFSLLVECLNLRASAKRKKAHPETWAQ